jgi:hypothetical protein
VKKTALTLLLLTPMISYANTGKKVGIGMAFDQGLSVVVDFNQQIKFIAGDDGLALDYSFLKGNLAAEAPLSWYVAGGAYYDWNNDFGVRIPIGMNLNFAKDWKLYAQIHPELNMNHGLDLDIGAALGVTYSF